MAVALVQTIGFSSSGIVASGTIVFTVAPTVGNLLIISVNFAGGMSPVTPPSGWTLLDTALNGTLTGLSTFYHIVGSSEANSYTFSPNGTDYVSMVAYEISGQAASGFINKHAIAADSAWPQPLPALTPTVLNCLAIGMYGDNYGAATTGTGGSVSSGWTIDQQPRPSYHSTIGVHLNALTTDLITSVSPTVTWFTGSTPNVSTTILIGPTAGPAPSTNHNAAMLCGIG